MESDLQKPASIILKGSHLKNLVYYLTCSNARKERWLNKNKMCTYTINSLPIFGRPFVKLFALCYRTVVLSVCPVLTVCDIGVLWPNGWMDQDETLLTYLLTYLYVDPGHIVRWRFSSPPQRGKAPNFRPMSAVAKWVDGLRCHLVWR